MPDALRIPEIRVIVQRVLVDDVPIMVAGKIHLAGKCAKKPYGFLGKCAQVNVIAEEVNRQGGKPVSFEVFEEGF
jgi:hypothetical protein